MVLTLLMALAAYRLWRIVGLDVWPPSRCLRDWLDARASWHMSRAEHVRAMADYPAGKRVLRRHVRWAWFWNETARLVECPWCLGAWVSGAVVLATDAVRRCPCRGCNGQRLRASSD